MIANAKAKARRAAKKRRQEVAHKRVLDIAAAKRAAWRARHAGAETQSSWTVCHPYCVLGRDGYQVPRLTRGAAADSATRESYGAFDPAGTPSGAPGVDTVQ